MLTSSITIIWTLSTLAMPFFIKSKILPGVAITTWTAEKNMLLLQFYSLWFSRFYVITEHYPSHPGAWYRLEGWSHLWLPWLWCRPGACWSEYWSDWPEELVHEWEPSQWLQANRKIAEWKKRRNKKRVKCFGRKSDTLDMILFHVNSLQQGDQVCATLSCPIFGTS